MERKLTRREVVINKGEALKFFPLLTDGRLQGVDFTLDGREVGLYFVSPDEYFGELSLVDRQPMAETVIALAPNLFFGTTIAVNILVLSKHKTDTKTQFIDASELFKKETNNNILTDEHIEQIMQVFDSKADVAHFTQSVSLEVVAANDFNLSVSSYVEALDTREVVDIAQLNAELKITVAKITELRSQIDAIVAEIEGEEPKK